MKLKWLVLSLFCVAELAFAKENLVIISPHRKSIQDEYLPAFKAHYKDKYKSDVNVEWIDQGGTSDDVRFLRSKFKNNPKTSGVDIFWGGGSATFIDLDNLKLLASYKAPADLLAELPTKIGDVPIYDTKNYTWYAAALSSFGIFYNQKLLKFEKLPEPKVWEDLTQPKFRNKISLTDPRRSGTNAKLVAILLQNYPWEKAWEILTAISANTKSFTHSSSDPIKAVVSGDVTAAMVVDFYALAKIADLGRNNLGFTLPEGQTVLDPDPISILKGAPNRTVAERFVNYVLSVDGQKLLVLKKGEKDGPKLSALGRMAISSKTYDATEGRRSYDLNPFKLKSFFKFDSEKNAIAQRVINDLVGALHIDTHKELKGAWEAAIKKGIADKVLPRLAKPPITEAELLSLGKKWDNEVLRNGKINEWIAYARKNYERVLKEVSTH